MNLASTSLSLSLACLGLLLSNLALAQNPIGYDDTVIVNSLVVGGEGDENGPEEGCLPATDGQPGALIAVTAFIPALNAGETAPVILHSHGWGGSRATPDRQIAQNELFGSIDGMAVQRLWKELGYIVVTFDERGWAGSKNPNTAPGVGGIPGDNTYGKVRGIDPRCETQDAIAILEWLEGNNGPSTVSLKAPDGNPTNVLVDVSKLIARESNGNMVLGTVGGSYGGGFQSMLVQHDNRIDAMVPIGTWNSLEYALLPNGVLKRSFASLLCGLGQTADLNQKFASGCGTVLGVSAVPGLKDDTGLRTSSPGFVDMLQLNGTDAYDGAGIYLTEREASSAEDTYLATFASTNEVGASLCPTDPNEPCAPKSNPHVLLVQGNRDVLFNMNEAVRNFNYYKDQIDLGNVKSVRMITNQSGHMNPVANQLNSNTNCGEFEIWGGMEDDPDYPRVGAIPAFLDSVLQPLVSTTRRGTFSGSVGSKPRCKGCKVERSANRGDRRPRCRGCKVERQRPVAIASRGPIAADIDQFLPPICMALDEMTAVNLTSIPDANVTASIPSTLVVPPAVNPSNLEGALTDLSGLGLFGLSLDPTDPGELLKYSNLTLPTQKPIFIPLVTVNSGSLDGATSTTPPTPNTGGPGDASGLVLAGVPSFVDLTVSVPGLTDLTNALGNALPTGFAVPNVAFAYLGMGIQRKDKDGDDQILLIDQQTTAFPTLTYSSSTEAPLDMPGVTEALKIGDVVGILAYSEHPQFEFPLVGTTALTNTYNIVGNIGLPIFRTDDTTIVHSENAGWGGGLLTPECNTSDPVGFVYTHSVCLDEGFGARPQPQ